LFRGWSNKCQIVVLASIINVIDRIWYARNQIRFNDRVIQWKFVINIVISKTSHAGNRSSKTHPPRAPAIIEVLWQPPSFSWIKCNIDGDAKGFPGLAACGGLFRDYSGDCIGGFADNLGMASSIFAE
jgi:hypothetical protein